MSSEHFQVEFSIIGHDSVGQASIIRNLAPQTFALIRFQLRKPIQSRVVVRDGEVNIPFKIGRVSPEGDRPDRYFQVQKGDIAYWPQSQILIIYLKDKRIEFPINIIGKVKTGKMKFFDELRIGRTIKLEMVKPPIDERDYL